MEVIGFSAGHWVGHWGSFGVIRTSLESFGGISQVIGAQPFMKTFVSVIKIINLSSTFFYIQANHMFGNMKTVFFMLLVRPKDVEVSEKHCKKNILDTFFRDE